MALAPGNGMATYRTLPIALLIMAALASPAVGQQRAQASIQIGDILSVSELPPKAGPAIGPATEDGRHNVRLMIQANRQWRLMVSAAPGRGAAAGVAQPGGMEVWVRSVEGAVQAAGADGGAAGMTADGMVEVARSYAGGSALVELEMRWPPAQATGADPEPSLLYTLSALD